MRRTDADVAAPPYPTRPLVAAAHVLDGWRFAAADGTLYAAPTFLGPLTAIATVPASARSLDDSAMRAVMHVGALAYVAADGRAWALEGHIARPMPLSHVVDAVFVTSTRVLAITAPGVLHRSDDGGAHFTAVPLRDEVPLTVGVVGDRAVVATTRRRATLDVAGALVDAPDAPSYAAFVRAPARPPLPRALVLPDDPAHVAALADGTLAVVDGDAVRLVDPARGVVLRTLPAPSPSCSIYPAHGSYRLACTHDGWARAVYAPGPHDTWTVLRDELRAEPMGAMVFDDASDAWVVAAPCRQQPQADPAALCVYLPDGRARPVHAPFAAVPVDMHGGVAAVVAADGDAALTRGALVRGESMTSLAIPAGAGDARAMRWCGDTLALWSRDAAGHLALHRAAVRPDGAAVWRRDEAPAGALRGVVAPNAVYAIGRDADALWRQRPAGDFARLPSPVRGDPRALPLDPDGVSYCAGPVCRLAGVLEYAPSTSGDAWFVTRDDAAPATPAPWSAPRPSPDARPFYGCAVGAALGAGPELDRGIAVSGYALHWAATPRDLRLTWTGATFTADVRGPWSVADASSLRVAAPMGATAAMALVSQCANDACARRFATARGLTPFDLASPEHTHRTDLVLAERGRALALTRGTSQGRTVAFAALVDPITAQPLATRAVTCDGPASRVFPGAWGGVDGLWIPVTPTRWRFVPMVGNVDDVYADDPGVARACAPAAVSRGVMRRIEGASEVRGESWSPADDEWQIEETLTLTDAGLCVRALAGGESRDESLFARRGPEADPVRSFSVTAQPDGTLAGSVWQGRRRFALTCTRDEGRARAPRPDGFAR